MGVFGIMFAQFNGFSEDLYRTDSTDIAQHLQKAQDNPKQSLVGGNIISLWTMDDSIENTFTK